MLGLTWWETLSLLVQASECGQPALLLTNGDCAFLHLQLLGCHGPLAQRKPGQAFLDTALGVEDAVVVE